MYETICQHESYIPCFINVDSFIVPLKFAQAFSHLTPHNDRKVGEKHSKIQHFCCFGKTPFLLAWNQHMFMAPTTVKS